MQVKDFISKDITEKISDIKSKFDITKATNIIKINDNGEKIGFIDIVISGGGVKNISMLGSLYALEELGFRFRKVAGTSAGAIIASMIMGCREDVREKKSERILSIISDLNLMDLVDGGDDAEDLLISYSKKKDSNFFTNIFRKCRLGINVFRNINEIKNSFGINPGIKFVKFMEDSLRTLNYGSIFGVSELYLKLDKETELDLDFQVVVSDISNKKKAIFPRDLKNYFKDINNISISDIIRCSMSIPLFFKPFYCKDFSINQSDIINKNIVFVDGGLVSNFPLNIFDCGVNGNIGSFESPKCPTFGLVIDENGNDIKENKVKELHSILDYSMSIIATATEYGDKDYIEKDPHSKSRIIRISNLVSKNKRISTTDFFISNFDKIKLFKNGVETTLEKINNWNFEEYIHKYRKI